MLTGLINQKQLEEFLLRLKPRQKVEIVFMTWPPDVATKVAMLIIAGLLSAPPVVTAALLNIGWRDDWSEAGRTFEFELTNGFTQPDASRIVAEAIWFGVGAIEAIET